MVPEEGDAQLQETPMMLKKLVVDDCNEVRWRGVAMRGCWCLQGARRTRGGYRLPALAG